MGEFIPLALDEANLVYLFVYIAIVREQIDERSRSRDEPRTLTSPNRVGEDLPFRRGTQSRKALLPFSDGYAHARPATMA